MDIHPSGFPRLVGPEGGDFSHFDFSSQFRVLPSNGSADIPSPGHESLTMRSQLHSLHLQGSPPMNSTPRLSQPLRIGDDSGRSYNSRLGDPRPHHPLPDDALPPRLGSPPAKRLSHSFSFPSRLPSEEIKEEDGRIMQANGANDKGNSSILGF